MAGGTEFRFVTDGIDAALAQARAAAAAATCASAAASPRFGSTSRRLIDELHLAMPPVLLGSGEHLVHDLDLRALGYECARYVAGERATHVFLRKGE